MIVFIKVDTSGADTPIAKTESGLSKVADAGKKAGEAGSAGVAKIGKSAGEAATALEKTSTAAKSAGDALSKMAALANPFSALTAQFAREAELLERIRGPMREYRAEMEALEMLHRRGAVSAAEYDNELQRLIKTSGTMHGPVRQAAPEFDAAKATAMIGLKAPSAESGRASEAVGMLAGQFGTLGTAVAGFVTKGTVATAVIVGLGYEALSLGNQYIELANKAQKLVAGANDVNSVLRTQMELSVELHGRLDASIELYDAVRDGTDELNLSQREQLQLTRDIGASVVASGKHLEQAGGLMGKLTYAFSSGAIGGRELKGIMKEFPDIGAAMVEALGHSRKELVRMANDGQLSADMLIKAFNRMGPEMLEKVGKKAETTGQMWGHFKDEMILSFGRLVESTGLFHLLGAALDGLAAGFRFVADVASLLSDLLGPLVTVLGYAARGIAAVVGAAYDLGQGIGRVLDSAGPMNMLDEAISKQTALARAYLARMEALKLLGVEEERNARIALVAAAAQKYGVGLGSGPQFDEAMANRWAEARITLKQIGIDIGAAFDEAKTKAVSLDTEIEKIKSGKAAEKIAEDARKIWKELSNTNDVLLAQDKAWKALVERAGEYSDAAAKVRAKQAAGIRLLREDVDNLRGDRDAQLDMNVGIGQFGKALTDVTKRVNDHRDAISDLKGAINTHTLSVAGQVEAYKQLKALLMDDPTYRIYAAIIEPARAFAEHQQALNSLLRGGLITLRAYNEEMVKLSLSSAKQSESKLPGFIGGKKFGGIQAAVSFDDSAAITKTATADLSGLGPPLELVTRNALMAHSAMEQFYATLRDDTESEARARRLALVQFNTGPLKEYQQSLKAIEQVRSQLTAEQYADALDRIRASYLSASGAGDTFAGAMELAFIKMRAEADRFGAVLADKLVGQLDSFNSAFVEMANGGEVSWGRMVDSMIQDLERLIMKQLEMQAISAIFGIASGGAAGPSSPLGFASGGSFVVGGGGGIDTTPVGFMATRGERVTIETPQQQRAAAYPASSPGSSGSSAAAAAPAQNVRIINVIDPSVVHAALESPDGERIILNTLRKNPALLRGGR